MLPGLKSALRILRMQRSGSFARTHSQTRRTVHPLRRSCARERRSRILLFCIFSRQALAFVLGLRFRPQLCPCQKQPSTKTASRCLGQAKSGLPDIGRCLRQPKIELLRSRYASRLSVVVLPLDRIRAISLPRRSPPKLVISLVALPGQRTIALPFPFS